MNKPLAVLFAGALMLALSPVLAEDHAAHHDDHHHHHAEGVDLLDLQRSDSESGLWATDEPLREGMDGLKAAFEPMHSAFRNDEFDAEQASELADQINAQVNFMIVNCSLPPEPDAELHKLLAASLGAARSLRESDDLHDGLHQLHQVLQVYPEYFDHPGWTD